MFFLIVGLLLILGNIAGVGPSADWGWRISEDLWKFCVPFGLAAAWWAWADWSGYNKRREMERMDAKKQERREKNLEALGIDPSRNARRGKRAGK